MRTRFGFRRMEARDGRLFLNYGANVSSVTVEPEGAIAVTEGGPVKSAWKGYALKGNKWGRARITVNYADGLKQSISYDVIKPATQTVADLGNFLFTKQWFVDPTDPFHRSPSVMTYDRGHDRIVTQDGLSSTTVSGTFERQRTYDGVFERRTD